ncbi:MAG: serine/threonine-protein kinase, partial [Limisphaerales bacterium]
MNSVPAPEPTQCPRCGNPIPAEAPQGLCPKCLIAEAMATPPPTEASPSGLRPPDLEAVAAAFPQLEVLELIGVGGMGCVFKARQPRLDRWVALKLLPQSLAANAAFAERFNREARLLARLSHPGIVAVHDFGQSGGFCYLLMEFVGGVNLRQAMRAGRFTPQQALGVVPGICDALQYAHGEGVLHRDIKPENILLDARGRVKIADFGIAKLIAGVGGDPTPDAALTASGAALGTPHYMAPEQIERPADVDHRADIYSLGVVLYEMLTGELPLGRFAAPSKKTPMDERVDEIVLRALAKERELRQQSAGEMKTEVEGVTSSASVPRVSPSAPPPASPAPPPLSIPAHLKPVLLIGLLILLGLLLREMILDVEGYFSPVNRVLAPMATAVVTVVG